MLVVYVYSYLLSSLVRIVIVLVVTGQNTLN